MKCFKHNTDAVAACAYCGRGVCRDCVATPDAPRIVCSATCADSLQRADRAMQLLLQKSLQSLKASAVYCYLSGGLSAIAAILAWFMLPSPFLVCFAAACAVALIASGIWYSLAARRQTLD